MSAIDKSCGGKQPAVQGHTFCIALLFGSCYMVLGLGLRWLSILMNKNVVLGMVANKVTVPGIT